MQRILGVWGAGGVGGKKKGRLSKKEKNIKRGFW